MSPRSLVGMTQGARKRAARLSLLSKKMASSYRKQFLNRDANGRHAWASVDWSPAYKEARSLYRLGQRLRPCPGCEACILAGLNTGTRTQRVRRMCSAIFAPHCDGSGVLPARKAVSK